LPATPIPQVATETKPPPTEALLSPEPERQTFFTLYSKAPIIKIGKSGTWDDRYTDPGAALYYDGMFHMFRNGFRGFPAESQVGYVTSPDGYTWTKHGDEPVFKTVDVPYAKLAMYASSALVEDDGTWVIYFYTWNEKNPPFTGVIGRATAPSPTGPWVADDEPILTPGTSGEWDEQHILAPHVLRTADGYVMYYSGRDSAKAQRIGMATSPDGVHWTKYNDPATTESPYLESDPVLTEGKAGEWDMNSAQQPRVFQTSNGWVMIYRGAQVPASGQIVALGIATSADGIHWDKWAANPVFKPTEIPGARLFWFHNALLVNDTYFLFVESGSQITQIYLATHVGAINP
jgi:predicted GH43/DUF377 family glycosyl hydrolase